jgi:site-specific recombinase XerD
MTRGQLFRSVENLTLPDSVRRELGRRRLGVQAIAWAAFVRWPNGKPCVAVNMYLMDNAHRWTGQTAVTYAAEMTELLRYCEKNGRRFSDLDDGDVYALAMSLIAQTKANDPSQRRRNDNRVRALIKRYLLFLDWYQKNLYVGLTPIVGERRDAASIRCEKVFYSRTGETSWKHRYMPTSISPDPKRPIALSIIEDIDASIEQLADPANLPSAALRPFKSEPETQRHRLVYLYERRKFMIWLLKRTGLRPGEMVALSLRENSAPFETHALIIPTLKRRRTTPPPRKFGILPKDELMVFRYLIARNAWFEFAARKLPQLKRSDSLFLSVAPGRLGQDIAKTAIEKDFRRLCIHAGHRDQESCLSMFRHRFITYEILAHLKVWEQRKGAVTTLDDYRSILERVRIKTGHATVDSLWHYIDLARGMEGLWAEADGFANRVHKADHFLSELRDARLFLETVNTDVADVEKVIKTTVSRLTAIIGDAKNSL